MNKLSLIASALAVLGLMACEKTLDVEEDGIASGVGQVTNSLLQVRTRAGSSVDEATVAYPVTVYVFQGDECKAAQTIGDEGQTLNIALVEGTYSVYAVGGASTTDYVLPSASDALTTSAITLREEKSHGDLMAAKATVTLVDGGTNTVTLGMTRKTMLIQGVTIKKIPTAATAVSVTIAPLWQALTVSGAFANAGQSQTIALTKQADNRTWTNDATAFVMPPSSQPASVSVNITIGGTTKTYTYSTSDQLEAGYKINIEGTYTEAVGVNLTGTITGATWLGERTISFEFDEKGSSAADNNDNNGGGNNNDNLDNQDNFPAVGDTYQGCYVLAVNDADDYAEVTLLSPTELTGIDYSSNIQASTDAALSTVTDGDISGWEVPTTAEAQLMYNARETIGNLTANSYLYHNGTGYRAFAPSAEAFSPINGLKTSTVLRPVATITINKD